MSARSRRTPEANRAPDPPADPSILLLRAFPIPERLQSSSGALWGAVFQRDRYLRSSYLFFPSCSVRYGSCQSLYSKIKVPCALCCSKLFFWQGEKCRPVTQSSLFTKCAVCHVLEPNIFLIVWHLNLLPNTSRALGFNKSNSKLPAFQTVCNLFIMPGLACWVHE